MHVKLKPPSIVPNLTGEVRNYLVRRGNKTLARCRTRTEAKKFIKKMDGKPDKSAPKKKRSRA